MSESVDVYKEVLEHRSDANYPVVKHHSSDQYEPFEPRINHKLLLYHHLSYHCIFANKRDAYLIFAFNQISIKFNACEYKQVLRRIKKTYSGFW